MSTTTTTPRTGATPPRGATPPQRSLEQRMDALARANRIRTYRAALKRDVAAGRKSAVDVIVAGADPVVGGDRRLETMPVYELIRAVPKVGRVKADKILRHARVSPSKTLGGLTQRQRLELAAFLRR